MKLWPFDRKDPTAAFWNWFLENQENLHAIRSDNEQLISELSRRLKRIHPGLVFGFAVEKERATEFVISADGIRDVFPQVVAAVKAAPPIPGWKITAYRQPGIPDVSIEMNGRSMTAAVLWFLPERDGTKIGLTVFIPGLTKANEQAMAQKAFVLLDNALGEFLVETSLGFVEFAALPEDPKGEGFFPFLSVLEHVSQVVH